MGARGRQPRIPDEVVRQRFAAGMDDAQIADGFDADPDYAFRRRMLLGLKRRPGAKPGKRRRASRHGSHTLDGKPAVMPPLGNLALTEGRTIYPSTVRDPVEVDRLLVSGVNSKKIGGFITKGPAKGFPIYTLTLEERATCPTSCRHWRSCYGNSMHLARRIRHGATFESRLEAEVAALSWQHRAGFAVRLHVLGDFYSTAYVKLWESLIARHRNLFVFGFTARWERDDPIARALVDLTLREWGRFSIRFSNAPVDECSTVSIEHWFQAPPDAVVCPAQMGRTESCGTCGLCWHTRRRIAFIQH